jgi:hypothetical protein
MSNENNTSTNLEAQPKEEAQQQLIIEAKEEIKGGKKPSTKAIRLATIFRLLDKHATQSGKVRQMVQYRKYLQNQMDTISKKVQPPQMQVKSMER